MDKFITTNKKLTLNNQTDQEQEMFDQSSDGVDYCNIFDGKFFYRDRRKK